MNPVQFGFLINLIPILDEPNTRSVRILSEPLDQATTSEPREQVLAIFPTLLKPSLSIDAMGYLKSLQPP